MSTFTKCVAFFLVYIVIGVAVTGYRAQVENWSSGGAEIAIVCLVYPLGYPLFELKRAVDRVELWGFLAMTRRSEVNDVCPPAYASLLRESVLTDKPGPEGADYGKFLHTLRRRGLKGNDPRTGFVLQRLSLAAAALGDASRVRADAEAFLTQAQPDDATPLWIAAALLRGAYDAAPEDAETVRLALDVYERAYAPLDAARRPYGAYALGTVLEAAGRCEAALSRYVEAATSGRISLGIRALVRAAPLASDDAARMALLEAFLRAVDYPSREERYEESSEKILGNADVDSLRFAERMDLVILTLGRNLFPLRLSPPGEGERLEAFLEEDLHGSGVARRERWWEEFAVSLEPAFSDFPAKLAMVERILDELLDLGRYGAYFDLRDVPRAWERETYYRLYAETGDERWLDEAPASQVRLRPALAPYRAYLESEVAFMRGEYRRHIDLVVETMLTNENRYEVVPSAWGYLRRRMDRLRVYAGKRDEAYFDVLELYLWKMRGILSNGRPNGMTVEELLRRYRAGEIEPPYEDFRDGDVRE